MAIIRDPAHATPLIDDDQSTSDALATDRADVELALRYLTDFSLLVLADAGDVSVVRVAIDAAAWGEATLITIGSVGSGSAATDSTSGPLVLARDDLEPTAAFATRVGRVAALLDAGEARKSALEAAGFRSAR